MIYNKKCLIVIDYQKDFVDLNGKLSIGQNAIEIQNNLIDIIKHYQNNGDDIIFTFDNHDIKSWNEHPESKYLPLHCNPGTEGIEIYGDVIKFLNYENSIKIFKKSFCMINNDINKIIENYDNILLTGVVTNICVLQNAIALYNEAVNLNKKVKFFVKKDCCAALDPFQHNYSLDYMEKVLGFEIL